VGIRIRFTEQFEKSFRRTDSDVQRLFKTKLEMLIKTFPDCPKGLRIEKLKSAFDKWSFRINDNYRVIFGFHEDLILLLEILSHDEFDRKY
jgi:mRNA-degrading endonuclease RelE of RelBE toxin-antitoxin system